MFSFDFDQVLNILKWTFPLFKERTSQLRKGPQSLACCVTRGVGVVSAETGQTLEKNGLDRALWVSITRFI